MAPMVEVAGVFSDVEESDPRALSRSEFVVLINTGDEPADLAGWSLTNLKPDRQHHFRYLLPRFLSNGEPWSLSPGGLAIIYTGRGTNGATCTAGEARQFHFYQHRSAPIWRDPGDRVCLSDRHGRLVATLDLPLVRKTA